MDLKTLLGYSVVAGIAYYVYKQHLEGTLQSDQVQERLVGLKQKHSRQKVARLKRAYRSR